ncbi:importin-11 [Parasteatoda tepidariorum]|uniref:importin-11 n=1 Tax=Parasteatoda tepidariorum TaxID=114398 RepID=UPI001C719B90|nr:importin-11 [Parasteatoda tepidariorum]
MDNQYNIVLGALTKASSQNAELLKDAEIQLKSWETERGFYSILLNIACDINLHVNIRWLSALCIKNGVDRYWRKTAPNSIENEERIAIKQKLLMCLNEQVNQIALQFAVIISKIARFDFPKEWAELFPTLLNSTQSVNKLEQQRALLTMQHVIKALSSKRLTGDRRIFYQLTSTIFSNIFHQWINYSKLFLQEVNGDALQVRELLDNSFLTLKILRKLVTFGFKECSKEPDAVNFILLIYQQIGPFLDCRMYLQNKGTVFDVCEKYIILLVKILRDVVDLQPFSFVQFIQPTLECCITFCFNRSLQDKLYERLIVQFMNVVKSILICQEYKPAKVIEEKNPLTIEAHSIKVSFFTLPVLKEICDQLLSRYFLLTNEDISSWENSPEEFASEEGGESWKFSLRPCTEVFFLTLFHEFRNLLTPLVVEVLQNSQTTKTTDLFGILKKDAVYNAVGLAAFDLYDEIDFDAWFTNVLIAELQNKEPGYHIIRRRVIWLIGQWVGVKMSPDMRPLLYEVILKMLNSEENLIVRLAASNTLKVAVDDFEFNSEQFLPFLEGFTTALFLLLKEVKECDLKMSILHVISFVVERMGSEIRPHAEALLHYLPQLWDTCGDHNMLRCAIISCFVHLVQGLGTLSESLQPLLVPMIALSTDVHQPPHVYLLEDGLDLWWAILDNTSVCPDELLKLASHLFPLLEYKGDSLPPCIRIAEAYLLLNPKDFLKNYGQALVETFHGTIKDMKSEGVDMLLKVVETVFILFPEDGPVLFEPLLPYVLTLALDKYELPLSSTIQLSILSRVILHNPNCFSRILQAKADECRKDVGSILDDFLILWLERMPLANPIQRKKLLGLALTCLLTSNMNAVHEKICGILLAVVEVLYDITKVNRENCSGSDDMLVINPGEISDLDEEIETEQDKRKRELTLLDPVYTVVLRDYLYNQVMALQQSVGATKFQDLMSTVDVETMDELQVYLKQS